MCIYIEDTQTLKHIFADNANIWSKLEIEPETSSTSVAYTTTVLSKQWILMFIHIETVIE